VIVPLSRKDRRITKTCLCEREAGWDGWCKRCGALYGDGAWSEISRPVERVGKPERLSVQTRIATGEPVRWVGHYGREFAGVVIGYNVDARVYHVRQADRSIIRVFPRPLEQANPLASRARYISRPGKRRPFWTFRHLIDCGGCGLYWWNTVSEACSRCGSLDVEEAKHLMPQGYGALLVRSDGTPPAYVDGYNR
jgi:hypothetical protein